MNNGDLVFTECWGITKTPTGYAVACGQGIENHAHKGDPRVAWRGTAVGVNFDGSMDWYRMDNWGPEQPGQGTSSAAYEWVTMHPDDPTTLVFIRPVFQTIFKPIFRDPMSDSDWWTNHGP